MTDLFDTEIRRRQDGSIDTAHYMAVGHVARARQARSLAHGLMGSGQRETEPRADASIFSGRLKIFAT